MKKFARVLAFALVAVMLCMTFASCAKPNSDPDKAAEALEDADYAVTHLDGLALTGTATMLGISGLEDMVSGTKIEEDGEDVKGEAVSIFYFEDADAADEAFEKIEDLAKDLEEDEDYEDIVCKKSGKMIWIGTKQAVKDAK